MNLKLINLPPHNSYCCIKDDLDMSQSLANSNFEILHVLQYLTLSLQKHFLTLKSKQVEFSHDYS